MGHAYQPGIHSAAYAYDHYRLEEKLARDPRLALIPLVATTLPDRTVPLAVCARLERPHFAASDTSAAESGMQIGCAHHAIRMAMSAREAIVSASNRERGSAATELRRLAGTCERAN